MINSKVAIVFALLAVLVASSEANSFYARHEAVQEAAPRLTDYPMLNNLHRNVIDLMANSFMGFVDQNLGRQARSAFGDIFGITSDEAMKVLFMSFFYRISDILQG